MSKQKEYELVVDVRYIVKADNVHDAIERWINRDYEFTSIDTKRLLEIKEAE